MDLIDWQTKNLEAIRKRLSWLIGKPDGILYDKKSPLHRIRIRKEGSQIQLFFVDPNARSAFAHSSGIMSRIDLNDPLALLGVYTQAMLLALLWKPDPRRIYTIGFAGGRLPMIFHHHFPHTVVESTDIDPAIPEIAGQFFGVVEDERQKVFLEDGRGFLEKRTGSGQYDILLTDAYRGTGFYPYDLGTLEFWQLCKKHLAGDGVVCVNLIESDLLYARKITTLQEAFQEVYVYSDNAAHVVFATDAPQLSASQLQLRAAEIQQTCDFHFPFTERLKYLLPLASDESIQRKLTKDIQPLHDSSQDHGLASHLSKNDPIFFNIGRNDPCPCGTGKKYKKCHGRTTS